MPTILDILQKNGVPYQLAPHMRVRRGYVGVDCPKCSPHHGKFRAGFNLKTASAHCWVCGRLFADETLALILNIPQHDARRMLSAVSRINFDQEVRHTGTLKLPDHIEDLLPQHRAYLQNERHLDPDAVASVWGVRGIGMVGPLKWRLFIPICDAHGKVVSWTTRSIGKHTTPRYWSASREEEAVSHKSLLYGAHLARHTIVIVEGPIDAWTIGPGCVATCGVGYTQEQAALMASYPVRVVLFDAEDDAQRRADALCEELCLVPGQTVACMLETGKDPNSADPAELLEFRQRWFPEQFFQEDGKSSAFPLVT